MSIVKRTINGTHHWISKNILSIIYPKMELRYNTREYDDDARFSLFLTKTNGRLSYANSVDGYIDKRSVKGSKIFKPYTIYISTDGEGSHSYSYVSSFEFVPNSNVIALKEKITLTIQEKLFYAKCITNNRFKFSYARKPKESRIANLILPSQDSIPEFVYKKNIKTVSNTPIGETKFNLLLNDWKQFEYQELFEIERGSGPRKQDLNGTGKIPLVTSSDTNNGWTDFTNIEPIHSGNTIGVNRNGSVAEAFYQPTPFCSTEDVHIFKPKLK